MTMTAYRWTIEAVIQATGGTLISGTPGMDCAGIAIDSRTISKDQIFVAIVGESHDGHRYIKDVVDKGVRALVVAGDRIERLDVRQLAEKGIACVRVTDTTVALGDLARFNRHRDPLHVVGVTGSNGKTSTRRLLTEVVGRKFTTLATRGNLNNHIGLPLTLLQRGPDHRAAVLEMGMNHAGEIAYLGAIAEPDVGVITNVGPAHLEGLGSLENIARAKGELLEAIRPAGTAVLNADDHRVAALAEGLTCRVMRFGTAKAADVRAEDLRPNDTGLAFTLVTPAGSTIVELMTPALVMVANALAAAATGVVLGIGLEEIREGLAAFVPQAGRMGIRRPGGGLCLIDDTYNANPASMAAAIDTLARLAQGRRTIAVLGDMLELGDAAEALHREIGRHVGRTGIDRLYVTGDFAGVVADGARAAQMAAGHIVVGTKDAISEQLVRQLDKNDMILVKGSRGMAMETVVAVICRRAEDLDA